VLVDAVLVAVWVVTRVVGVAIDGWEEKLALANPVWWLDEAGGECLTRAWLAVLPPSEGLVTQAPYGYISRLYFKFVEAHVTHIAIVAGWSCSQIGL
jgi:hypothetical protein